MGGCPRGHRGDRAGVLWAGSGGALAQVLGRTPGGGHAHPGQTDAPAQSHQHTEQLTGVAVALGGVTPGGPGDHLVQFGGYPLDQRTRPGHVVVHVLEGDRQCSVAAVRRAPGEQLVEQHTGGVDVAACVGGSGHDLFGAEVRGRAEDHVAGSDVRCGHRAHQPEVGDLDGTVVGDEHVLRLDVAVHQPGPVRGGQRGEHRLQHGQRDRHVHGTALPQEFAQGAALYEFHDEERVPAVAALVVHRDQRGVAEPGHRASLELEAGQELRIIGEHRVHDLDGHRTVQAGVEPAVHRGHAAPGDGGVDPVAALEQLAEQVHPATHRRHLSACLPTTPQGSERRGGQACGTRRCTGDPRCRLRPAPIPWAG